MTKNEKKGTKLKFKFFLSLTGHLQFQIYMKTFETVIKAPIFL